MLPRLLIVFALSVSLFAEGSPRISYLLHCGGCHLPDGAGAPPEVPSLRGDIGRLVAVPGGRDYLVRVPGASQAPISNQELADVLNWVLYEFNADTLDSSFEPLSGEEVGRSRPNILADPLRYREQLWADY